MWIVPFLLTACWAPRETGPHSMVGYVVDASGAPLTDLKVESVEAEDKTDTEGAFAVNYKEPSQHVFFTHQDIWFKRVYEPSDDTQLVRIQTPPLSTQSQGPWLKPRPSVARCAPALASHHRPQHREGGI